VAPPHLTRLKDPVYVPPNESVRLLVIESGMVTHLIPLREAADLDRTASSLEQVVGRYARIKIAKWFVYDKVERLTQMVRLQGCVKGNRTKPVLDTDAYRLNATPSSQNIQMRFRDNQKWVEVDVRQVTEARDLRAVVRRAARLDPLDAISLQLPPLTGDIAQWDRLTVWMLGFLELSLSNAAVSIRNFSMAHYERVDMGGPPVPDRPQIDEVQLRGQHVGSNRDSCQLIVDGRRLINVEVLVQYVANATDSYLVPIRIGIGPDYASVTTGTPRDVPGQVLSELHRHLVLKVRRALDNDLDVTRLAQVVRGIIGHARETEPAAVADLFVPPTDGGDGNGAGPSSN
jgi:hypothetical protein